MTPIQTPTSNQVKNTLINLSAMHSPFIAVAGELGRQVRTNLKIPTQSKLLCALATENPLVAVFALLGQMLRDRICATFDRTQFERNPLLGPGQGQDEAHETGYPVHCAATSHQQAPDSLEIASKQMFLSETEKATISKLRGEVEDSYIGHPLAFAFLRRNCNTDDEFRRHVEIIIDRRGSDQKYFRDLLTTLEARLCLQLLKKCNVSIAGNLNDWYKIHEIYTGNGYSTFTNQAGAFARYVKYAKSALALTNSDDDLKKFIESKMNQL